MKPCLMTLMTILVMLSARVIAIMLDKEDTRALVEEVLCKMFGLERLSASGRYQAENATCTPPHPLNGHSSRIGQSKVLSAIIAYFSILDEKTPMSPPGWTNEQKRDKPARTAVFICFLIFWHTTNMIIFLLNKAR